MRIAILGAGPSGMCAAHAASQCGHEVTIYDKSPDRSRRNSGIYYLHRDCDLKLDKVWFKQAIFGVHKGIYKGELAYNISEEQICKEYSKKVYGKVLKDISIKEVLYNEEDVAFNANQAVNRLWDLYGHKVAEVEIRNVSDVYSLFGYFDKVISTIPANIL